MKPIFNTSAYLSILLLVSACSNPETIAEVDNPAGPGSQLPFLYTDNTGTTFLSWVEPDSSNHTHKLLYAKFSENNKWSEVEKIAESDSWFINWADYPSVIANSGTAVAAHQLKKIPGNTYSYNVTITQKANGGWGEPFTPHFDSTATEHGFVSMVPVSSSDIMAIWLDGRKTEDRPAEEYFNLNKAMTLRSALIDSSGTVKHSQLIDESVCDCCQTSMAMTKKGPVAAYRNRTGEEIRDIYVTRYRNGSWSEPKAAHDDGWKIGACPVNGPKIAAKDSIVVVSWYTAVGANPVVKTSVSKDYGNSFTEPFLINSKGTLGRVDVAITDANTAYVSEVGKSGDRHFLNVHKLSFDEGKSTVQQVTEMSGSRSSGFPQMELRNDQLILAWTEVAEDGGTQIKTALIGI